MAELIPMRSGEEIPIARLTPLLEQIFPGSGPWLAEQYASGHSNLTYLLRAPAHEVVLRRPPNGPVPPRAHDMMREFRLLEALHPLYRWTPKVYWAADGDSSPLGVPFFLMERRTGVLIDASWLANHCYAPDEGRRISDTLVARLVDLHGVEWSGTPIHDMVKPEGFLRRQVEGWIYRYQGAKAEDIVGVSALCQWLLDQVPGDSDATVIHYDYKLNNLLLTPDLSDLAGIFDWEMATVGDPLADVAVVLSYWVERGDSDALQRAFGDRPVTLAPGFYSRREWLEAYARQSGRHVRHVGYYLTFAYFKLAVIVAQIYFRYANGQTDDTRFQHFGALVRELLQVAMTQEAQYRGD